MYTYIRKRSGSCQLQACCPTPCSLEREQNLTAKHHPKRCKSRHGSGTLTLTPSKAQAPNPLSKTLETRRAETAENGGLRPHSPDFDQFSCESIFSGIPFGLRAWGFGSDLQSGPPPPSALHPKILNPKPPTLNPNGPTRTPRSLFAPCAHGCAGTVCSEGPKRQPQGLGGRVCRQQ